MSGIGNDIVALKTVDINRTITPRFYQKFLSPAELDQYHRQPGFLPFHDFIWMAWSAKEAAFKCLQRLQPDLVFSPIKIEITKFSLPAKEISHVAEDIETIGLLPEHCYIIELNYDSRTLYARSVIYGDELIHTTALFDEDFLELRWSIRKINSAQPKLQSTQVRKFLTENIKTITATELTIKKNISGIPTITLYDSLIPVSISHHGNWVGYTLFYH